MGFTGLGAMWVTRLKILGGDLGGSVVPIAYIKSRIEGNSLDVPGEWQFTDISVTPVQLGRHAPRSDYVAGYSDGAVSRSAPAHPEYCASTKSQPLS